MVHACNLNTLGGRGRQIACTQEFNTSLSNMATPYPYKNTKNISQAWWDMPVVPATWEAEMGGLIEPRKIEDAVSQDQATTVQPGQQEGNSISKKKK